MQMARQLEFSLFDFKLHLEYNKYSDSLVQDTLDQVRSRVSVYSVPKYNRFQNSFSHIFAGGYAAGYFSYKWAEVLSSDAFSLFEENGIFNMETGHSFMQNILEKGGSVSPGELFKTFRGRAPSIEPLLKSTGINN